MLSRRRYTVLYIELTLVYDASNCLNHSHLVLNFGGLNHKPDGNSVFHEFNRKNEELVTELLKWKSRFKLYGIRIYGTIYIARLFSLRLFKMKHLILIDKNKMARIPSLRRQHQVRQVKQSSFQYTTMIISSFCPIEFLVFVPEPKVRLIFFSSCVCRHIKTLMYSFINISLYSRS